MKAKKLLSLLMEAAMCASISTVAFADDYHLELKMSHVFAPNEALTITMQEICDNILERTDGAIEIQHFPQGHRRYLPVRNLNAHQALAGNRRLDTD